MPLRKATPTTDQRLEYVRKLAHNIAVHDRWLRDDRAKLRRRIAELHGAVPVEQLAAAAGITRQHVHRLVRSQQREV